VLDFHPNGMTLTAYGPDRTLHRRTYFSVGGGFVVTEGEAATEPVIADEDDTSFSSAAELLALASGTGRPISEVMLVHERRMRGPEEVHAKLLHLRDVMVAPTNGAAGIMPAVLHYAVHYTEAGASDADDVAVRFLLTAGAIGSLYKERASISGAEVGCQGEVGSASSMAAGGLAEILGGTPEQVENAAEIAMEHSLGLTCDPIAGLVQIPCIERNAISAGKAINAARMALRGDGAHRVSLDEVIATMRATGRDMSSKYKETSTGGLAVNVSVNYVGC
jgi:L-serine deaminase